MTPHSSQLYKHNFKPFLESLPQQLSYLKSQELSTAGRIATLKMLILPKLLYLFRTLIIPLPNTFLSSVQKLFTQYIWNHKPPRCSLTIMLKHRRQGGMGVPNVLSYYKACVMDQIKYWWTPSKHKSWTLMESTAIPQKDLKLALIAIKMGAPIPTSLIPTI